MPRALIAAGGIVMSSIIGPACAETPAATANPSIVVVPVQPPQPLASAPASAASAPSAAGSIAPVASAPFRCDGGKRFEVGSRSYCAHVEPDSWEASERRCVADGGHLMSLDNAATSEALHRALGSPVSAGRAAWIGLELKGRKPARRTWTWLTGEPLGAASWNAGEPNDFDGNESCAEWLVVDGRWNDTRCELRQPYLCQGKSGKPLACKGERELLVGGIPYCLHMRDRTQAEARAACIADGGSLAVLKTAEENGALRDAMAARFAAARMWIGLTDGGEEGNWSWTSGAPLEYAAWQPGEPNDFNGEDCAELHADVWQWNDLDCAVPLPSVCESPPRRK